jgi:hypothetical protein
MAKSIFTGVKSFVLCQVVDGVPHYVRYGHPPALTPNIRDARRYNKVHSAQMAIVKLLPNGNLNPNALKVEVIEE